MKRLLYILVLLPLLAFAQTGDQLQWQQGPTIGTIGSQATIKVPRDFGFLDKENSRRFAELTGNIPAEEPYILNPFKSDWFIRFTFDASGYVADKEKIDADDLLKTLKEQAEEGNRERQRQGLGALILEGWEVPPHYDSKTQRLEWCLRYRGSDGKTVLNCNVRILGREGVMEALLVIDPKDFAKGMREFHNILTGFAYIPEKSYQAYQKGDKVSELGLAALIVGGAAAVAGKKFFGKLLLGIGAAVVAAIGYFFKERKKS